MALAMPQDWTDKASDEHVLELGPAGTKGRKPDLYPPVQSAAQRGRQSQPREPQPHRHYDHHTHSSPR